MKILVPFSRYRRCESAMPLLSCVGDSELLAYWPIINKKIDEIPPTLPYLKKQILVKTLDRKWNSTLLFKKKPENTIETCYSCTLNK